MKIAGVVVDVPNRQTDKLFHYKIPEQWLGQLEVGMRVIVPFGPRNIQGFVMEIIEQTDVSKLRDIIKPMDATPVLTEELLELASWLKDDTFCFTISALQVMLPAALKTKVEKKFIPIQQSEKLQHLFHHRAMITWKQAEEENILAELTSLVKQQVVDVEYEVKGKAKKKTEKWVVWTAESLEMASKEVNANAKKQQEIITLLETMKDREIPVKELKEITSLSVLQTMEEKRWITVEEREVYRDPYANRTFQPSSPLPLTEEQQTVITPILDSIENNTFAPFLLFGVTGSGKTEVYLQSIAETLKKGKEAIVLVPEISLTPQIVQRFKQRFGDRVAVLHSGLSIGEKYDEWRKVARKEVSVVVGARSAIFAPFTNLGLIIIDEEHESSYKQDDQPRYHARDVAMRRAEQYKCPVVLGSATPSLESFARAKKGVYHLLTMKERVNARPLPTVSIVDMRDELKNGNRSMFSTELFEKMKDRLEKKEQIVLFLNRRGHSSFIMCRDCGYVAQCTACDVSLTYHRSKNVLKCHYCGEEEAIPSICPSCQSEHIRYFGTGTQKVEEEIGKLIPEARVIRMDVDTTSKKGSHERLLKQFERKEADILLGTQMIAKGLDFPSITLVGVLSADTTLHIPDFRAAEKTFQLLTQVSGRAGRHELPGEVVVQTYTPEHYSIDLAKTQKFETFYQQEMQTRKIGGYPPFYFLVAITMTHEDLLKVVALAEDVTMFIRNELSSDSIVLGPVACSIPRIKNRYRYQCLIKYKREANLNETLKTILRRMQPKEKEGFTVSIDRQPL